MSNTAWDDQMYTLHYLQNTNPYDFRNRNFWKLCNLRNGQVFVALLMVSISSYIPTACLVINQVAIQYYTWWISPV